MWEALFAYAVALFVLVSLATRTGLCRSNTLLYAYYGLMAFAAVHVAAAVPSVHNGALVIAAVLSHHIARTADPGSVYYVDLKSRDPVPPRCSICGRHVKGFDHHCGWLATDIGARNVTYFRAFLIAHLMVCAILASESFIFLADVTARMNLWDVTYRVGDERNVTATRFLVAQYLGQHHMSHFLTMLLGVAVGFSLSVFTAMHYLK